MLLIFMVSTAGSQFLPPPPPSRRLLLPSGAGNDHYIMDSIVFSSKVGLEVNGEANFVKGVHVWFPMNQALAFVAQGAW